MDAGNEKAGRLEQRHRLVADQRQVEIAGAGTLGIEGGAVLPALAGHCAAAEHNLRSRWDFLADQPAELLEARLAAVESEPQDIGPLLLFRESALDRASRLLSHQF